MEFFYHIKATQKSGKPDAIHWETHKTEARANLALDVALEDAEIETGRGKDYLKPIRTDFPMFDDLPEEGVVDFAWCERYELDEDQRTWKVKLKAENAPQDTPATTVALPAASETTVDTPDAGNAAPEDPDYRYENGLRIHKNNDEFTHYPVCKMPFRIQLLSQLKVDELRHHVTRSEYAELHAMDMDTDNGYVQDLLLAAASCAEVKAFDTKDLWRYTNAVRKVFSMDKRHELGQLLQFTEAWVVTAYIDRGILTREWAAGNRINIVERTDTGTNADAGYVTDRGEGVHHTLETLDLEIACALLPMDFNHLEIPVGILRRAKEIVSNKEDDWKSWSKILRNQPGVLAVNRAAIFNLVRIAPENIQQTPIAHLEFVNQTMTAEFNAATELMPIYGNSEHKQEVVTQKMVDAAWQKVDEVLEEFHGEFNADEQSRPEPALSIVDQMRQRAADEKLHPANVEATSTDSQPQVANLGGGKFSIDGLMNEKQPQSDDRSPVDEETTSNVQMETNNSEQVESDNSVSTSQEIAGTGECVVETAVITDEVNFENAQDACAPQPDRLYTHLMVDLEAMGKKPGAPIVSIGAVFFAPDTGETGREFYAVVNLESSMSFGARPDAGTILWWLKQSPEARSAILVDDTTGLVEALENFTDFIARNAANGSKNVQLWGNGSSFDCSILEAAFELADTPFPIPHWNYRDVRTVVELGKTVGLNARYDIPFEGDQHNALADARHQVKYVSAIWQRLTAN